MSAPEQQLHYENSTGSNVMCARVCLNIKNSLSRRLPKIGNEIAHSVARYLKRVCVIFFSFLRWLPFLLPSLRVIINNCITYRFHKQHRQRFTYIIVIKLHFDTKHKSVFIYIVQVLKQRNNIIII